MKLKTNFRSSLFGLFAISIFIPVVITTLIITAYLNAKNIKTTEHQARSYTEQLAMNINTYYRDLANLTYTPALYKDIFRVLSSFNRGYYLVDIVEQNSLQINYINTYTKMLFTDINDISIITFYPANPQSNSIYEINKSSSGLQVINSVSYHEDDNYKKAIKANGKVMLSDISYKTSNSNKFYSYSVLRAIKDYDTKKIIGVLCVEVNFNNIQDLIHHIEPSENSMILLANNDKILYSSKKYQDSFEKKMLASPDSFTYADQNYTGIYVDIPDSDWKVYYVLSKNDQISNNNFVYIVAILVASFTILIAFVIFLNSAGRLVKSVNLIVLALNKIRGGDLSVRINSLKMNNELRSIAVAVNEMTINLDKHMKQEYIAVVEQKNAENRALQSQINPHFMYNTLNCLLALNRMGEKVNLESAVINLAKLLRYTSVSEKSVTLQTELDFLDKYVKLQKIHFEDKLTFVVDCQKCCENIQIPKLSLQPLVENSIVHGLEPTNKPMTITISATYCIDQDLYTICIKDNGIGFDLDKCKENTGLSNVRKRLKLWNEELDFSITSEENVGTCIIIKFKL
ncbi:histidine kinase [Paenibacillus sp.]|uniref:sensor histidine kinase n=1 Tax=Paenibacillus sp. TaxID=58172 RepID=UPI0028AD7D63|nr:histidine kinase [Paenibacillus sp.]